MKFQTALCDLADETSPMKPESICLFKSVEKSKDDLNIPPEKRIDLFSLNSDVNAHNESMISLVNGKPYTVKAEVSILYVFNSLSTELKQHTHHKTNTN